MKYLVGSHFWGCATPDSDQDIVEILIPTRSDFWEGRIISNHNVGESVDISEKDIRQLLKELRKGSVNAFTVLYANQIDNGIEHRAMSLLRRERDCLLEDLHEIIIHQAQGELRSRIKKENKSSKEIAHIYKLCVIILALYQKQSNPFVTKIPMLKTIRAGKVDIPQNMFDTLVQSALAVDVPTHLIDFSLLDLIEQDIMDMILDRI